MSTTKSDEQESPQDRSNDRVYFFISSITHAALLLSLILMGGKGNGGGREKYDIEIIAKSSKKKINKPTPPQEKQAQIKIPPQRLFRKIDCPKSFNGIGLQYDPGNNQVTQVFDGYPAKSVGIEPGDIIVSPSMDNIKGKFATELEIVVYRGGETIKFELTRDKICIKDKKKKQHLPQ